MINNLFANISDATRISERHRELILEENALQLGTAKAKTKSQSHKVHPQNISNKNEIRSKSFGHYLISRMSKNTKKKQLHPFDNSVSSSTVSEAITSNSQESDTQSDFHPWKPTFKIFSRNKRKRTSYHQFSTNSLYDFDLNQKLNGSRVSSNPQPRDSSASSTASLSSSVATSSTLTSTLESSSLSSIQSYSINCGFWKIEKSKRLSLPTVTFKPTNKKRDSINHNGGLQPIREWETKL